MGISVVVWGVLAKETDVKERLESRFVIVAKCCVGEMPHQCEYCPKKFSRKEHLVIHTRQHTGKRCLTAFTGNNCLKRVLCWWLVCHFFPDCIFSMECGFSGVVVEVPLDGRLRGGLCPLAW